MIDFSRVHEGVEELQFEQCEGCTSEDGHSVDDVPDLLKERIRKGSDFTFCASSWDSGGSQRGSCHLWVESMVLYSYEGVAVCVGDLWERKEGRRGRVGV